MDWVTTSDILDGLRDPHRTSAWDHLVGKFRPAIESYARRMGLDAHAAEDVAQVVLADFSESYRRGKYERKKGSLRTWLFTIAHHRLVDALRQRPASESLVETLDAEGTEHSQQAVWQEVWDRAVLEQCLDRVRREVTETTYAAFEASFLREQPTEQVAEAFGMSMNAVFLARYRVLTRLRALGREMEEH